MQIMINVMITGVGGPAGMATIQSLRVAPEKLGIIGVDMNPLAPGLRICDYSATVPACSSADFAKTLIGLCKTHDIRVMIPTVDEEVSVLSTEKQTFANEGISVPIPNFEAVKIARDKYASSLFENVGVRAPKTVLITSESDVSRALQEVGLPCVIKRRFGRGGRGFALIDSMEDATYWINKSKAHQVILQEKIDGHLLLVQGISKEGRMLTSIVHKRLETKSEGSGTAISAVTIEDKNAIDNLAILLRKLRWTGAIGVEFLQTKNNQLFMIDVNPRICGQSHLSTQAGINLAYGLVELATKEHISLPQRYELGKAFVRVWQDVAFSYSEVSQIPRMA
jgi:carbamoyl-phosphate synthase large subunit